MSQARERVRGTIIAVQEERFRLMTETGETLLLTLAPWARVSIAELGRWEAAELRVQVVYSGEPNLVSGTAHFIEPVIDEWRVKSPIRLFI